MYQLLLKNLLLPNGQVGYIAIANGLIAATGPMASCPPDADAAVVENRPGCIAWPGLRNAHTHVAMSLLRGLGEGLPLQQWLFDTIFPAEARLTAEAVYYGAMASILEMLAGGTTCFCDMYDHCDAIAQAASDCGIRAQISRGMAGSPDFDQKLQEACDVAAKWHNADNGRITCALGPHAEYTTTPQQLRAVAQAADQTGLPIHIHAAETAEETQGCLQRHGLSPIAYFDQVGLLRQDTRLAHCVHTTPQDWQLIAQAGAIVAHNPGSNLKLGSGIMPLCQMLQAGVRVELGTDGPASDNRQDMLRAAYLACTLPRRNGDPTALSADQALALACCGATLQPGQPADLFLADTNRLHTWPAFAAPDQPLQSPAGMLVFSASAGDVVLTVVDGIIRYRDGQFPGIDTPHILAQAAKHAAAVRN